MRIAAAVPLVLAAALAASAPPPAAWAAGPPRGGDPDWPCVQRLVPRLSGAALWPGFEEGGEGWRGKPRVAALVARIAPRAVAEAEGVAAIAAFAAPLDAATRRRVLPLAFSGALEETNRQRDMLIEQIRRFTRRQREVADRARDIAAELRAMPDAPAGTEAAARRTELEQRRHFTAKAFEDAERTLRYVCEAPVRLEARLGAYARALRAALPED
jgi:hypothetical protein